MPRDWLVFEDKVFLTSSGTAKLIDSLGIQLTDVTTEYCDVSDAKWRPYRYVAVSGIIGWFSVQLPVMGLCSERDQFFQRRPHTRSQIWIPTSAVTLADLKRLSYTDMVINAVVTLLGMREILLGDLWEWGLDWKRIPHLEIHEGSEPTRHALKRRPIGYIKDDCIAHLTPSRESSPHGSLESTVITRRVPIT
jgi:hypothetical protein